MFRGVARLGSHIPRAVRSYSSSASVHGGVVTQVIGAVVDVQVSEIPQPSQPEAI